MSDRFIFTMNNKAVAVISKSSLALSNQLNREGIAIARGGIIILFSTVMAQGLSMLAIVWIARALGPDQYGLFSLALSILLPITTLASIGLNTTVVRFIPIYIGRDENSRVTGVLYSALSLAGVTSIALAFLLILLSSIIAESIFHDLRLAPVLRILAFAVPLMVAIDILVAATRGLKVMHFDAIVKVANPLFRLLSWGAALYLLTNFLNLLNAAVYATLIGTVFTAVIAFGLVYKAFKRFLIGNVLWSFKPLLLYSLPLVLSTLMYTLAPRIDRLLLGVLADTYTVGIYSVAASLAVLLKLLHNAAVTAFSPTVSDLYNRVSVDRAKKLYLLVTRWDARLTFVFVAGVMLLAQEVISFLGTDFQGAILPFMILAISVYMGTLPGPTGAFLQMTNRQKVEALNALLYLILGTLLQFSLALWVGWIGVAFGVLVTAIMLNIVQVIEIRHFYKFHPFHNDHLIFSLISIAVLVCVAFVGISVPFLERFILFGFVLTSFLLFIYLSRDPNDQMILQALMSRRRNNSNSRW